MIPELAVGELMGHPITCNTANMRRSLKIIHLTGRNRLPHFKVHLKHCGFEKAVVLLENVLISKGGLCMS
ncbi:unnamed protein product, partial [Gulo gulo]